MTKIVSGLFDNRADADAAIRDLKEAGFHDDEITLIAKESDLHHSNAAEGAGAGAIGGVLGGGVAGLAAGVGAIAIPGIGPVVAAGWIVTALAGVVAGAGVGAVGGGLLGSLSHEGITDEEAHVYAEGIRRGGSFVAVRTTEARLAEADAILHRFQRADIIERRRAYAEEGWSKFDDTAAPYTDTELAEQRQRWMR